jgi:hypothetical protein
MGVGHDRGLAERLKIPIVLNSITTQSSTGANKRGARSHHSTSLIFRFDDQRVQFQPGSARIGQVTTLCFRWLPINHLVEMISKDTETMQIAIREALRFPWQRSSKRYDLVGIGVIIFNHS